MHDIEPGRRPDQPVIPTPGEKGSRKDREAEWPSEPGQRIRGVAGAPHGLAGVAAGQEGDIHLVAILGTLGHSAQQAAGVRADPTGNGAAELLDGHQHPGAFSHPDRPRRHGRAWTGLPHTVPS